MKQKYGKTASCELEKELFENVFNKTPDYIKELNLIDLSNKEAFTFILKREHLYEYDEQKNPEGLNLLDWFKNYEKEAQVSTAGIRGPQNILYPQDTRFPINLIGIVLATTAKALVAKEKKPNSKILKLVAREVRYNSDLYLNAIARIQAAYELKTLVPFEKKTIPIWMASFLIFKLGLYGGEYITSSHGISVKNATKDLNSQGGQYLPEESMEFVNKIREIFNETEKNGTYEIKFSAANNPLIDEDIMNILEDGIDLYVDYLRTGVGRRINLDIIEQLKNKIVIENIGGSAYRTLSRILEKLDISKKYDWLHKEEDPFFHSIGKSNQDSHGKKCFYDYSLDAGLVCKDKTGGKTFPVINTLHYDKVLADYPLHTVVLITDPDHDRLTIAQIENIKVSDKLDIAGIDYLKLTENRILTLFTANQAFLMLMDFRTKILKKLGAWERHPRFIIKTTASTTAWDEWAKNNGIKVINVPVGFKEIANIMKKVENKHKCNPDKDIIIEDVFGKSINLGIDPRLLFAGEESGGMIMGPDELICSKAGCIAIAMREKSAAEAVLIASALIAKLETGEKTLSQYLLEVFSLNDIISKFDTREDISYYNESESDIVKLKIEKVKGEEKRTKNDLFFLSLAMGIKKGIIELNQVKEILNDAFKELDFSNLKSIEFVGDGTYMHFDNKFIEIRPSGTDAKTKSYAAGLKKPELEKYAQTLGHFSGVRTELHRKLISDKFYHATKDEAMKYYLEFVNKDAPCD